MSIQTPTSTPVNLTRPSRLTALHERAQGAVLLLGDVLSAVLCLLLMNAFLHWVGNPPMPRSYVAVWTGIWVLWRLQQGLYPGFGRSPQTELRLHTVGTLQVGLAQFAVTFAGHDFIRSRLGSGLLWALILVVALPIRYMVRALLIRFNLFGRPVSVLGGGQTGTQAVKHLLEHPGYGLKPVAVYDDNPILHGQSIEGVPIVGDLEDAVVTPLTSHAIISIPGLRAEKQRDTINMVHSVYQTTWATPDLFGVPNQALIPHNIGTHASLEIRNNLRSNRAIFVKRGIDLLGAVVGGVLISPLLLLVALAIRLDSPGPIVYRARRLGQNGRLFDCYKFRSMHRDADAKLKAVLDGTPELKAEFEASHKLKVDPRVTRVGALLRKTSLDELPQLLNVITGQMSLVGPRPIVEAEITKYGLVYQVYKQVRPGMTGYWQANGRSDTSYEERVGMDHFYVTNWTPWLDFVIMLQTVRVVLLGKGAY